MKKHILYFIVPMLLYACESQQQRQSEQLINRAATSLDTAPDSSLHLLGRVDTTRLSRRSKARLQILSVRAKDKLDMNISADTAVFPAEEYLVKIEDEYAATACFAAARVYEVQNRDDQALYNYLLAADRATDNRLNMLVYYNIGRICYAHHLHRESLAYTKKALAYDKILGSTGGSLGYTMELIAMSHYVLGETDSSLIYFHKALRHAQQDAARQRIHYSIGLAYHKAQIYTLARDMYKKALSLATGSVGPEYCQLGLAGVYAATKQNDSAYWFIRQAKPVIERSNSYSNLKEMYRILSVIEVKQPDKAFYQQMYKLFPVAEEHFDSNKIIQAKERYKNDVIRQREEERDRIATGRKIYFLTILNLVLVLFIGVYFVRRHLYRKKGEHRRQSHFLQYRLEKEQQASDKKREELRQQHEQERQRLLADINAQRNRHERERQALFDMIENERERYEQKIDEIRREHDREMTAVKRAANDDRIRMLLKLDAMAELHKAVYEATYDVPVPGAIREQFEKLLQNYSWDALFPVISHTMDGMPERIRKDFPALEEKEYHACCFSYIGLRTYTISMLLNDRYGTTKNRVSKARKEFGLSLRGSIHKYLNAYYEIPDDLRPGNEDENEEENQ